MCIKASFNDSNFFNSGPWVLKSLWEEEDMSSFPHDGFKICALDFSTPW